MKSPSGQTRQKQAKPEILHKEVGAPVKCPMNSTPTKKHIHLHDRVSEIPDIKGKALSHVASEGVPGSQQKPERVLSQQAQGLAGPSLDHTQHRKPPQAPPVLGQHTAQIACH